MAAVKRSTAPSGIETSEYHHGVAHTGTRDALIAAGLAEAGQFPGEPGCGKTSTVFPRGAPHRGHTKKMRVSRRGSNLFMVLVYWSPDERAAWEKRWQERYREEQQQRADAINRRSADAVGGLMRQVIAEHGSDAPRKLAEAAFEAGALSLIRAFNLTDSPEHPWHFPVETREEAKRLYHELRALFDDGGFRARLAAVAQGDQEFQRFMARAAGPTPT